MTFNKKIVVLISCVSILLCILTVQDTYAKYSTSNNALADISIARWRILVNDFDVRNNLSSETVIQPVFSGNENIQDGYIAPTAKGYFDIVVDATETDVSFDYVISVGQNEDNQVTDLVITGYKLDDSDELIESTDITGTINYDDENKTKSIRVFIEWNDSETQEMNNAADTATTTPSDATAKLDVGISFVQLASE